MNSVTFGRRTYAIESVNSVILFTGNFFTRGKWCTTFMCILRVKFWSLFSGLILSTVFVYVLFNTHTEQGTIRENQFLQSIFSYGLFDYHFRVDDTCLLLVWFENFIKLEQKSVLNLIHQLYSNCEWNDDCDF